jgi:chromate transporter
MVGETVRRAAAGRGSAGEVLRVFLRLGLTSFGGPIAHLGYFRAELVERRRWLDDRAYADLVALCQFLPGPASSQVGFALGLSRAGLPGGLAAWLGFTAPSVLLLLAFAQFADALGGLLGSSALQGLRIVAVAVVAQAVWGMARSLAPDRPRAAIALAALLVVTLVGGSAGQLAAIALGGVAGWGLCRGGPAAVEGRLQISISRRAGTAALVAFFVLLAGLPLLARLAGGHALALFEAFYRSGALVFGGGHVVLPLLQQSVVAPGWVSGSDFLAGYGAAQALPGPLFSVAAYLGAVEEPAPHGLAGAAIALAGIFLPGMLILAGALPFWDRFRRRPGAQAVMRGINAAVVGLLGAALYDPVWTGAIRGPRDFVLAALGFVLLVVWRAPPWSVVLVCLLGAVAARLL